MIDTSFEEGREQLLLAKQAELLDKQEQLEQLQAEITAIRSFPLSTSPSNSSQHGRIHKQPQQQRRSNIPRSFSSNGTPSMARQPSSDRIEIPQQRARTFSQRSAPSMARANSRGSTSQRGGNLPLTQNGAMPPPLHSEPRRDNPAMMAWTQQDQPLSSYTLSHQPSQLQRSISQRGPLEQVRELEDLTDPDEFFRNMGTPIVALSPSISIPSPNTISSHRLSSSYNIPIPSTPTTDMLTTATTFTDSMSRQNSLCNEPFLQSIEMMKFNSNTSFSTDVNYDQSLYDQVTQFPSSRQNRRSSNEEQSKLLVGTGGASHESQFSHSFPLQTSTTFGEKMEKSASAESTSSSSSSHRSVKRLQDQIRLAHARPLIPKADDNAMSRENSSQSMTRIESRDGSQDNKVAISKPSYQRPKHDRVYCKLCENHQEGFRGEHELRRHQDREHKSTVKKWMCIEPSDANHPKPVVPLARCKACVQRKKYGAYYNAAAHLRRAHFNPKPKGRGKTTKTDEAEKRGGKGGGDWPQMNELKYWMKEVEEQVDLNDDGQQEAADQSDEETVDNSVDEQPYSQQSTSTMLSNNSFDNAYIVDGSMLNQYPAGVNNELFGMQTMPLDLTGASQGQCGMDQSMYNNTTSVPNNFSSFSPDIYQNEQILFYNNSSFLATQNVEDQLLAGPDFGNNFY
jgi:hypothetical protein